jgi:hypothetical protein
MRGAGVDGVAGAAGAAGRGGAAGAAEALIAGAGGAGGATTAGGGGGVAGRGGAGGAGVAEGGGAVGFSAGAVTVGRAGGTAGVGAGGGATGGFAAGAATAGFAGAGGTTAGRGGTAGFGAGAAASFCCVIAFNTSPGREMCDRSILVLISSSPRKGRAVFDDCPAAASPEPLKCARTFTASCSSSELEWVFFSVTPTSGSTSRMALLLTSSSLARSLIRTLLIRPFPCAPRCA